jgi:hypothetical protein
MNLQNIIHNKFNNDQIIIKHSLFDNENMKCLLNINVKNIHFFNLKNPWYQRVIYSDKIKKIVDYQINHYNLHTKYVFINNIIINYCVEDNEFYLIDGQHRLEAALQIANQYNNPINLWFEIILSNTTHMVNENFNLINDHTLQPLIPELQDEINVDKFNQIKDIYKYYENKYKNVFKSTKTVKKPFINSNEFQEAICYLINNLNLNLNKTHNVSDIIHFINEKNDIASNYTLEK